MINDAPYEVPAVLIDLQEIYQDEATRTELFRLLDKYFLPGKHLGTGHRYGPLGNPRGMIQSDGAYLASSDEPLQACGPAAAFCLFPIVQFNEAQDSLIVILDGSETASTVPRDVWTGSPQRVTKRTLARPAVHCRLFRFRFDRSSSIWFRVADAARQKFVDMNGQRNTQVSKIKQ